MAPHFGAREGGSRDSTVLELLVQCVGIRGGHNLHLWQRPGAAECDAGAVLLSPLTDTDEMYRDSTPSSHGHCSY